MAPVSTPKTFAFVGGALCLDFCNTVGGKRGGVTREKLESYLDLVSWSQQAGLVDKEQARALALKAASQPDRAVAVLERAIALREAIYRVFLALAEGKAPANRDVAILNSELGQNQGRLRVACRKASADFAWEWVGGGEELGHPLGPLARSAAELLVSCREIPQVRQCGGENCGWLFIDSSKNHSRRWCDMRDCGNRAKVRRHRLKRHQK
jgi:predicted RNA-binding Zn ribbon-like protein